MIKHVDRVQISWKFASEDNPTQDGFYVVWRIADEGPDHPPAEWDGVEEWSHGSWAAGDWGIARWWDQCFATMAEAETAKVPDP
jgi:hypothetical protein